MKPISEYLINNHVQKNIQKYHWPENGISDETLKKCEENSYAYLKQRFNKTGSDELVKFFMDTYREYLEAEKVDYLDAKDIENDIKWMNSKFADIKKIGVPAFINNFIPQAWYHYINWKYENNL